MIYVDTVILIMSNEPIMKPGKHNEVMKKAVLDGVLEWTSDMLKDYVEPERAGTAKGDPIGFPKKKLMSAAMLAIYPKVTLKEIGAITGVKPTVLGVWRTQENFKAKEKEFARRLGDHFARIMVGIATEDYIKGKEGLKEYSDPRRPITKIGDCAIVLASSKGLWEKSAKIRKQTLEKYLDVKQIYVVNDSEDRWTIPCRGYPKNYLEDVLVPAITWLGKDATKAFVEFISDYLSMPGVVGAITLLKKEFFFWNISDKARIREWKLQPWMLDLREKVLLNGVDMLIDPEALKQIGPEGIKSVADLVKTNIIDLVEMLRDK